MVSGLPYRVLSRDVSQVAYWFRRSALANAWMSAWTRGNALPSTGVIFCCCCCFQFPQSLTTGNGLIGADSYTRRHCSPHFAAKESESCQANGFLRTKVQKQTRMFGRMSYEHVHSHPSLLRQTFPPHKYLPDLHVRTILLKRLCLLVMLIFYCL